MQLGIAPLNRCELPGCESLSSRRICCVLLPYSVKRAGGTAASAEATKRNAPLRKVGLTAHV